jgi:outer membrane lipoprotein-sorting protein
MRFAAHCALLALAVAIPMTAASATEASDADWTLATLMASLQQVKSASALFTEHKYVGMLTQPLEASGTLTYVAPNRLEKITGAPATESILLQDDELSGTRSNGDRYSVSLSDHPDIAALVEGVRSTLAGDLPTLQRYYTVASDGTRAGWQLMLTPRDKDVRAKVELIRIVGVDAALQEIDVLEADGDHSEMFVTPAAP